MTMRLLLRRISVLLLCVSITQFAFSQASTKQITGKITDDKGAPVSGASVSAKGGRGGTTTDASGSFTLTVANGITALNVSSVGYTEQEISIPSDNTVTVVLSSSSQALNDVVVIGYGTVKRKDATGALTTVSAKEFNKGVISSPDQLLQNKVSGLEVVSNSGQPGSATTIKIRGNNSISGSSNPLYVVDGIQLDGRSADPPLTFNTGGFGSTPASNPLLYINPADIQDITILKDASSTAIYGSRGANGVIVITTKKATAGAVRMDAGLSVGANIGYMKKFEEMNTSQFRSALAKYHLDTLSNSLDKGGSSNGLDDITWHKAITNYTMAVSGGNDNGKFRASILANRTPGLIRTDRLDKYIGNFQGDYKFLDKRLDIFFGLIAGHTNQRRVLVSNTAGSAGNLMSAALQWNPTSGYDSANGKYVNLNNGTPNPQAMIDGYNDQTSITTLLGNIGATLNILPGLQYKFVYSNNQSDGKRAANIDGFIQGIPPITGQGLGTLSNATLSSQVLDHTLQYNTDFAKDLHFTALAGYEYIKTNYNFQTFSALGFNINNDELNLVNAQYTDILQNGNTQSVPAIGKDITSELQSYFARVDFNWKDKYYLTATLRADGSSKFGSDNRYGYFPSIGAKWNLANEDFLKDSRIFSGLSLRGSWGITGNQDFASGSAINQFAFGTYNSAVQYNGKNPALKWESTTQYDFGLDFSFFNNRLYGNVDYYHKDKTDILFPTTPIQPAPLANIFLNLPGHLINQGIEFSIGGAIVQNKDFSWDMNFNISYNHGILRDFTKGLTIKTGTIDGQGVSGTLGQVVTNNEPIDAFNLKPFLGFDQNGNQQIGANPVIYGNPNPSTLFGGSTTLRFKKLSLNIAGGGSGGFLIYNNTATSVTNISGITSGRNVDRKAIASAEMPSSGVGASQRFLENGNFFKLRNATFSYAVGNLGNYVKNVNVFVSGSNLFVITKFTGFDPEVNIDKQSGGFSSRSIEYIPYPTPRAITAGLNFSL